MDTSNFYILGMLQISIYIYIYILGILWILQIPDTYQNKTRKNSSIRRKNQDLEVLSIDDPHHRVFLRLQSCELSTGKTCRKCHNNQCSDGLFGILQYLHELDSDPKIPTNTSCVAPNINAAADEPSNFVGSSCWFVRFIPWFSSEPRSRAGISRTSLANDFLEARPGVASNSFCVFHRAFGSSH